MAAFGRCWPHVHDNLAQMFGCRDYQLATLYDFDGLARREQAVAGSLLLQRQPVSAAAPVEGIGAPLATPPIFIRVHRSRRPSRRGIGVPAGFSRSLFMAAVASLIFSALLIQELASWLAKRRRARRA